MKCEMCGEDKEYFGSKFIIRNEQKIKQKFYVCDKHIPCSEFSEVIEDG